MSRKHGFVIAALLVAAFSVIHLFLFLKHGLNVYDEGVAVYGAERVAMGAVPYRDFWTMYAPGQFYALAAVFKVFGFSLVISRLFTALSLVGIVVLVFVLFVREGRPGPAAAAGLLAVVWVSSFEGRTPAMPCAVLFALAGSIAVLEFGKSGKLRHAVCSGVFTGVAAVFRHDIGAYAAIAQLIALISYARGRGAGAGPFLCHVVGLAVVGVPVTAALLFAVPIDVLVRDLVVFPAVVYPAVRSLPYPGPGLQTAAFYFVPLMFVMGFARVVAGGRTVGQESQVLMFSVMGMLFMGQAAVRSDITHLFAPMFPAIVLFVLLLPHHGPLPGAEGAKAGDGGRFRSSCSAGLYLAMIVLAAIVFLRPLTFQVLNVLDLVTAGADGVVLTGARADGIRLRDTEGSYAELIAYLQRTVPSDGCIFSGNTRHDRIAINDVMLYFLCGRASATRHHELHPGIATTAECQAGIVRELRSGSPDAVVLGDFGDAGEKTGEQGDGARILDEFIAAGYVAVTNFGSYEVMSPR